MMFKAISFFYLLVLGFPCYFGIASNNSDRGISSQDKCSFRYDLVAGIGKFFFDEMTCSKWYESISKICNDQLTIWYYDIPPYTFTLSDGSVGGIVPALLNISMDVCCSNCTRIVYLKPFKEMDELASNYYNTSFYSILMPVIAVGSMDSYFKNPYVKLLDTPGVVFVRIDKSADIIMEQTIASVTQTWPLFVIMLLLTLQGGVFIWMLDSSKNPDEFSPSFLRGALEGSWWAYVSMTTVGYGDKAPRSFFGRVFAMFWITMGIAISGIFTASLASSLTSAALPGKTELEGLKVGILMHSILVYEDNIVYREGGTATNFENVTSMINALRNGKIDGILIDSFILQHHWNAFNKSGLNLERKYDVVNSETGIGIVFSSPALEHWAVFLRQFFKENKDAESRLLKKAIDVTNKKLVIESKSKSETQNSPFAAHNVHKAIMMAIGISSTASFLIGIVFDIMKRAFGTRKRKKFSVEAHEMETKKDVKSLDERFDEFSNTIENVLVSNLRENMSKLRSEVTNSGKSKKSFP